MSSEMWLLLRLATMRYFPLIGTTMLVISGPIIAKPWKNIYPLKTTRAEVIKELGQRTKIDEYGRATYLSADGVVKISWKRADCISKDFFVPEMEADGTALVYQITFEPNRIFKSVEEYQKPDPIAIDAADKKAIYSRWLEEDVNCLIGADNTACSKWNSKTGFGYSDDSKSGVTAIYYFATADEIKAFIAKSTPCVDNVEPKSRKP